MSIPTTPLRHGTEGDCEARTLTLSTVHLHRTIEHYRQLRLQCLAKRDPLQRRMASVYQVLEQERRALLLALQDGCPERSLDYLEFVSECRASSGS